MEAIFLEVSDLPFGVVFTGLIALQIHGGCKAEIAFRNLEIQELP